MRTRSIAGFMSAESIYSLAFYIVMVAAVAGIGAGVMSKSNSAKAVAAVALVRANYQLHCATFGYGGPQPNARLMVEMSGNLLTPHATAPAAILPGVAVYSITNRTNPPAFSINVEQLESPDVCKAVGSVGWGTWQAVVKGILLAGDGIPVIIAAPGNLGSGLINTGATLNLVCNAARMNQMVQLTFISQ